MKALCIFMLVAWCVYPAASRNSFKAYIKDKETRESLVGASVVLEGTSLGASADTGGYIMITNIPDGFYHAVVQMVGYIRMELEVHFPAHTDEAMTILMLPAETELSEVVVTTTRSSRTIADEPTRVEAITAEELEEKSNMKPGDIRMLLSESTGIQVQQASATTANAGFRIQGLEGRYTQILKDGFPLYSGFAGGLSIMQIPPLDLQQVEVIKGSASTLYGGGAIAGLINLISKSPSEEPRIAIHLNGTTAGGLDLNGFYSNRLDDLGFTVFAARNSNAPYDPAGIDMTAIPEFERYTFNPRFWFPLGERTSVHLGANATREDRIGGDIHVIEGRGDSVHSYFERNRSSRVSTQVSLDHATGTGSRIVVRNSISIFDRILETPGYRFDGNHLSSFTEATFTTQRDGLEWIAGANLSTERFAETSPDSMPPRDYTQRITGGFVQTTWNATNRLTVESGLRLDYAGEYGMFVLPRISILFTLARNLTSRVGGGFGYKLPTVFTEEAEVLQFRNILPVQTASPSAETSLGGNIDVNYRSTLFGLVSLNWNQLFFYTKLDKPLLLVPASDNMLMFVNAHGHIDTKGTETNVTLSYKDLKLLLGYTYTDAKQHFGGALQAVPLTPRHRLNSVLMHEAHDAWRIGLEAYYFGRQLLTNGGTGRSYWICGFMVERMWEAFSLYINFENFFDTRQTRFDSVFTGPLSRPQFNDIYAPMDGFVMNGGIKLRL